MGANPTVASGFSDGGAVYRFFPKHTTRSSNAIRVTAVFMIGLDFSLCTVTRFARSTCTKRSRGKGGQTRQITVVDATNCYFLGLQHRILLIMKGMINVNHIGATSIHRFLLCGADLPLRGLQPIARQVQLQASTFARASQLALRPT